MADELFDGNIASEMTLGEAIVRGILNPPKYVLSVYSYQKDLEKYQRKISRTRSKPVRDAAEKYLDALRRALDMADGLDEVFAKHMASHNGKYIVFCPPRFLPASTSSRSVGPYPPPKANTPSSLTLSITLKTSTASVPLKKKCRLLPPITGLSARATPLSLSIYM